MNIKKLNQKMIDTSITFITIVICLISLILENSYSRTILGITLILFNLYMVYKFRKNKLMFFSMLTIFYFNYSFVITRYIGKPSNLLDNLYNQLYHSNTLNISIIIQIFFLTIINLVVGDCNIVQERKNIKFNSEKNRKILILMLQIMLLLILVYHLINKISYNTTLLEYSIILFIFIFYYTKNDKKNKIITEILLLIFSIYSIKNGDRIAVLQFMLSDFVINYLNKFKIRNIIICMILGIFMFTFAGLYGDFLDYGYDFENLTISYVIEQIKERRLALDTSVSAYFSGISMIDVAENYTNSFRINNAIEYFTKYTILGNRANYKEIDLVIRDYQVNYGGGLPTCYFYFWAGWIGVIAISLYVGFLFKIINKRKNSEYTELLSLFIVSTIPRWYLYIPTLLFRGILIFSIFYVVIYLFFLKNNMKVDEKNEKNRTIS